MAATLHFYGTHSVLPLAFYTTFGKWRHTEEVTWLGSCVERECERGGGRSGWMEPAKAFFSQVGQGALSGRYKGTLCASDSGIVVMHALAVVVSSIFLVDAVVMASPQK